MKENPEIKVVFRKSRPLNDSKCRYPGFSPGTSVLPKGSVHRKGALPLPCDITFEHDVAVPMHDGVIIYVDIFRPIGDRRYCLPVRELWLVEVEKNSIQLPNRQVGKPIQQK